MKNIFKILDHSSQHTFNADILVRLRLPFPLEAHGSYSTTADPYNAESWPSTFVRESARLGCPKRSLHFSNSKVFRDDPRSTVPHPVKPGRLPGFHLGHGIVSCINDWHWLKCTARCTPPVD